MGGFKRFTLIFIFVGYKLLCVALSLLSIYLLTFNGFVVLWFSTSPFPQDKPTAINIREKNKRSAVRKSLRHGKNNINSNVNPSIYA